MEYSVLEKVTKEIKSNKEVALVTVTKVEGSSPGRQGAMMAVFEDGTIEGTVGGGRIELISIKKAKECIKNRKNGTFTFQLNDDPGSLHMQCGGEAEIFIKVFIPPTKLLIVGGGHIGLELYKLVKLLKFHTVVFDNRYDYCNKQRFPDADEIQHGNIEEKLKEYNIAKNCYIVIVTHGHKHDEVALKSVVGRNAAYIGVIGSRQKTDHMMNNLKKEGLEEDELNKVYSPIGLGLGGNSPSEIAFSIISEILLVKNKGKLAHMKDIK